ncbi:MAG TPA: GTPase Era [Candidatus Magasanikbacteria bacterium]|nr:MAG: GTPase Era [Candidatus Magasanikbacteria bacterium RIFOXYC2_FULL_39_8]HAT03265.1 GTPase Era [Candidatus Magasanikbacteria bacterium]
MKSGFAVLIGRSNVGKSTLINTLVGTKIAATSFRAQMTRNIIHGALTTPEGQVVFIDTPGIFKDKKSSLTGKLIERAKEALDGVDVILYVVDPTREIGSEERYTYGLIRHLDTPKILVINKSDLTQTERKHETEYERWGSDFDAVFSLSALRASHIQPLKEKVIELLPQGEPMYIDKQITNVNEYFWVAEIIREKIFSVFDKEVPYSMTVDVDSIEEKPDIFVIQARILTDQERYKKLIIGKGGNKIKEIGKMARKELEQSLNKKVYLELEVEIDIHWVERI